MTNAAIGETPAEPVPPVGPAPDAAALPQAAVPEVEPPACAEPVPPAPEATVELEAAAPEAPDDAAVSAEGPDLISPNLATSKAELEGAAQTPAERALPEIEHAIGPVRQGVLDHLLDSEGAQTVAQIIAGLGNYSRGTVESAIRRELVQGRIERVGAGLYALAKVKLAEQPKAVALPEPEPVRSDGMTDQMWFDALEAWHVDPSTWNVVELGPPPDRPNNNVPSEIRLRFADRVRKREERRREAEAAAAKRGAADRELRDKLLAATGGNVIRGPGIEDVSPIQMAMQLVPLERILSAIRNKTDKKLFPGNEPATSWREERLLREIADSYFRSIIQPRLVDAWSKAGRAPTPGAQSLPLQASDMPDIDELRGLHDSPSAPPGPHVVPQEAVERAEPSPAVSAPASEENAPVSSTAQSGAIPGDRPAIDAGPGLDAAPASDLPDGKPPEAAAAPVAPPDDGGPVAVGRAAVLAAFNRARQPQPAPQPRPPERRMERQAEPKPRENLSEDAVDELIAGWQAGNLAWPRKLLGEEPGHPGCRLSREALRRNGLA